MTYVVSDIHGCDKKYFRLLEMLHFSDNDTLYILGDVTDRGSGGLRVLLDAASRQNVILLRGNHEQAALEFLPRDPDNEATPARLFARWYEWMEDGGDRTYRAFWNRSEAVRARVLRILGSISVSSSIAVMNASDSTHRRPSGSIRRRTSCSVKAQQPMRSTDVGIVSSCSGRPLKANAPLERTDPSSGMTLFRQPSTSSPSSLRMRQLFFA